MKTNLTFYLVLFFFVQSLPAQKLPTSNIYLFDMRMTADSGFLFTRPRYLSHFNSKGYNNQPYFMNDEELYITVQMADDTTQTDIYSLNFVTGVKTQVTDTPESEYSATYKIGSTNSNSAGEFSCVRVEQDQSQHLWLFPLDRSHGGKRIFNEISDIGYHNWVSSKEAALFIVGAPHRLVLANFITGRTQNIASNIGRCIQRASNSGVYYLRKLSPDDWYIRRINPYNRKTFPITQALPGSEDFAVMPDGSILMAKGSKLFCWSKSNTNNQWKEIADFSIYDIHDISRLAYRNGKLALVDNTPRE